MRLLNKQRTLARGGMAYVAILILLMLASVLALAFSHRVGTQLAILDVRADAIQAEYLAESAANHAMWRMLESRRTSTTQVTAGTDDAIQTTAGGSNSTDGAELGIAFAHHVGTRFQGVGVPRGARIHEAWVEFVAARGDTWFTELAVWGEASDNAANYVSGPLSSRTRTTNSVEWSGLQNWSPESTYSTPDLGSIIQEIVNRAGWSAGNSISLLYEDTDWDGRRRAYAFEGDATKAPRLIISYEVSPTAHDEATYYTYSMSGGKYGFRVRDFTDTTFGTIATFGAKGDVVVQQSHVLLRRFPDNGLHRCLVGWWQLDDGSGLVAIDSSGRQPPGELVNMSGSEWTSGYSDGGLQLAGDGEHVDFGAGGALAFSSALTLSLWIKPDLIFPSLLLDKGYADSYYLFLNSDGSFELSCASSGAAWSVVSPPGVVQPGEWQHLAATFDGNTGEGMLFRNGIEVRLTTGISGTIGRNNEALTLGAGTRAEDYPLEGLVDDVRAYSCALDATEVAELYCSSATLFVSAGLDQVVDRREGPADLLGSAGDSCPTSDPADLVTVWSQVSGPGMATFGDDSSATTIVSFSKVGDYVLRLTADNGTQSAFEEVTFTVGGNPYIEKLESWSIASSGSWVTVDLGSTPFGLPAGAVAEVAVTNTSPSQVVSAGVRSIGSTAERTLPLHEAEGGGVDAMTMQVQTDSNSTIECYASSAGSVEFLLLGYWARGSYVDLNVPLTCAQAGVWETKELAAHGVAPGLVVEVAIKNESVNTEFSGGVRGNGATLSRFLELQEAESGGADIVTMMAKTDEDPNARIQLYAQHEDSIAFTLLGYWSVPPGDFEEACVNLGALTQTNSWEVEDMSAHSAPGDSVASLVLMNTIGNKETQLGVRETGSSLARTIELMEAESGGGDMASLHVLLDETAEMEWFRSQPGGVSFWLLGWWRN